jgi:hypothetical protein
MHIKSCSHVWQAGRQAGTDYLNDLGIDAAPGRRGNGPGEDGRVRALDSAGARTRAEQRAHLATLQLQICTYAGIPENM